MKNTLKLFLTSLSMIALTQCKNPQDNEIASGVIDLRDSSKTFFLNAKGDTLRLPRDKEMTVHGTSMSFDKDGAATISVGPSPTPLR